MGRVDSRTSEDRDVEEEEEEVLRALERRREGMKFMCMVAAAGWVVEGDLVLVVICVRV